jgi:hypothetical protein
VLCLDLFVRMCHEFYMAQSFCSSQGANADGKRKTKVRIVNFPIQNTVKTKIVGLYSPQYQVTLLTSGITMAKVVHHNKMLYRKPLRCILSVHISEKNASYLPNYNAHLIVICQSQVGIMLNRYRHEHNVLKQ